MKRTSVRGEAVFTGLTGPHWFVPWHVRTSTGVGGRSYTGKIQIEVVALGQGVNYDYVVDPSGMGTHTTLQAAITAAVSSGARAIWVCTSAGTLREDIVIPDTAGETNDGAMFLIHTAPWSSIVQIEDPGELAPAPPRVRLQPSTDDTPAIVAREPVQFQGFRIDNQYPANHDAEVIQLNNANVIAEFKDCELVQYDADKPLFDDGGGSLDVVKLENCIVRHDSGYYIMSTGFNLAGGLLMRRVSAYGVWNSIHAFRLIADTSGFKANDADHPVFDGDGGYTEARMTNCRVENAGAGGTFTCATGYANGDLHISNTHFKGSGAGTGLRIAWCHKATVSGCTFEDFAIGVDLFGSVSAGIKLYGIAISDNVFDTCTTGINDGGNLDADELATIITYPNAYYNCTTDSDFWLGPDAGDSSYTPNQGDDWPGDDPDDVAEALDDLADRLQDVTEVDFFVGTATGELSAEIVLTYAQGSIIYGGASAWSVLGVGDAGTYLAADGTDVAWTNLTDYSTTLGLAKLEVDDANFFLDIVSSNPHIQLDTDDSFEYDRGTNRFDFEIGGSDVMTLTTSALTVKTSYLYLGDRDATMAQLVLYGASAGASGGLIYFHVSGAHDDAFDYYVLKAYEDDFILEHNSANDLIVRADRSIEVVTGPLKVDTINEYTGAAGVTIDGVLIKDQGITVADATPGDDFLLLKFDTSRAWQFETDGADGAGQKLALTSLTDAKFFNIQSPSGTVVFEVLAGNAAANSRIGFYGVTPVARSAAYTTSNVSADRAFDANATTIDELADVLGTLIADLKLYGLLQ